MSTKQLSVDFSSNKASFVKKNQIEWKLLYFDSQIYWRFDRRTFVLQRKHEDQQTLERKTEETLFSSFTR